MHRETVASTIRVAPASSKSSSGGSGTSSNPTSIHLKAKSICVKKGITKERNWTNSWMPEMDDHQVKQEGISARTSGLLDELHIQTCGSEYSRSWGILSIRSCGRSTVASICPVLAEMWPSVPNSLPRSLRTVEMDSCADRLWHSQIPSVSAKLSCPTEVLDRTSDSESWRQCWDKSSVEHKERHLHLSRQPRCSHMLWRRPWSIDLRCLRRWTHAATCSWLPNPAQVWRQPCRCPQSLCQLSKWQLDLSWSDQQNRNLEGLVRALIETIYGDLFSSRYERRWIPVLCLCFCGHVEQAVSVLVESLETPCPRSASLFPQRMPSFSETLRSEIFMIWVKWRELKNYESTNLFPNTFLSRKHELQRWRRNKSTTVTPVVCRAASHVQGQEQSMLNEVDIDFRIPGLPHSVVKQAENYRVRELVTKIENRPHRHALHRDPQQNKTYNPFNTTTKKMIQDVGNVELFELFETDPKTQCKECLSYWSEGIVYCTCGQILKEIEANRGFIEKNIGPSLNSRVRS